jgi:hypothetical protein
MGKTRNRRLAVSNGPQVRFILLPENGRRGSFRNVVYLTKTRQREMPNICVNLKVCV